MRRIKLDKIDRKILKNLQEDGRMSNVDLAKVAGISAPPCLRRVRALEEGGYIEGYHAQIKPAAMGYNVVVFAQVELDSQADDVLKAFEEQAKSWPQVRECHLLSGKVDFLLKIAALDWDDYQKFHSGVLTAAPHVESVKSSLTIRTGKCEPGVPISVE